MKITIVAGCRPEFVKLAPVVAELRRRGESPTIVATGQHTDLLQGTPFADGMKPDANLQRPGTNDPIHYAGLVNAILRAKWARAKPEVVIVQGDTASAYAGACAAQELGIPVAHIEAGIRSGDTKDPWPEEIFRTNIDGLAQLRFCATAANRENLGPDNTAGRISGYWPDPVTGNPGIDALYSHTRPVEQSQKVDRVLITLHRRESFGEPLKQIVSGIWRGADQHRGLEFVWPTHPNPHVQEAIPWANPRNVVVASPMDTALFAQTLARCRAVITDSGGVQEEAAALGIPCIVAREKTDRPESVELGLARVAGRTEAGILEGLAWALDAKIEPSHCFGDGAAAPRIVEHLLAH